MDNTLKSIVTYICVISILVIVVGVCIIATTEKPHETTSILNNIGGAIGGFTSSIIGITSIVLVYMAYSQQLKANEYLKQELLDARWLEKNRYEQTKNLIIFDLNKNIRPQIDAILLEILTEYSKMSEWHEKRKVFFKIYNHLNTYTFDAIDKKEIYSVFGEKYRNLIFIYSNINYIKSRTLEFTHKELLQIFESKKANLSEIKEEVRILHMNNLKIVDLCQEVINLIDTHFPKTSKCDY